ncbi:MAG: tRNA dimethylallyltransferase [Alphaproteobacteria bacterium MarineAlpha3_Bin5]|nr:tRNA (adenosine(37)-N6)-dimethylallyltransferase MiaA [Magnetovibrio sp.]PPR80172.1 MAG: tRNA dimethylallyltransferase [Alphaproteobacteria bacterium MarineAlpha3_Bin5]
MSPLKPVIIIGGPTASGKTKLALDISKRIPSSIINADSIQVYRELEIISSRPTLKQVSLAPHRLFGALSAHERCSAGRWLDMARIAITEAWANDHLPIMTGGTGLYLKVLIEGIAQIPDIPPRIVKKYEEHLKRIGGKNFKEELAKSDPHSAIRLLASDSQRLVRAASVLAATGRTMDSWQSEKSRELIANTRFYTILLFPPRQDLYLSINNRVDRMIAQGALDEARNFAELGVDRRLPAAKAIGLVEFIQYIENKIDLASATQLTKQKTRNLAKRQMTWFKNSIDKNILVSDYYSEPLVNSIVQRIQKFVLTDL